MKGTLHNNLNNYKMYKYLPAVVLVAVAGFLIGVQSAGPAVECIPLQCLGCLCEALSRCDRTIGIEEGGLFYITWGYWSGAGKPTQPGETPDAPQAFSNCVTEPFCAARTVQGYMAKFQQDCNLDGKIDCLDYALMHKFGRYGCKRTLPEPFGTKLTRCLAQVGYQLGMTNSDNFDTRVPVTTTRYIPDAA